MRAAPERLFEQQRLQLQPLLRFVVRARNMPAELLIEPRTAKLGSPRLR